MTHVFFDLDGTLTDPAEGIVNCLRHALSNLDIEIAPEIRLESFIGPPIRDVFRELCGGDENVERAVEIYRERFSTIGLYENRVYEGIVEALDRLAGKADPMHVVTSKPTVYSERIIEYFGLKRYFKAVYGSCLDGRRSDKSELLAAVLENESIRPRDAVMIGDRKFDMAGAKHHGIRALGVLWGYGTRQELESAGADALCAHPADIHDRIFTGPGHDDESDRPR